MPLWEADLRSLRQVLAQALPEWAAVQLDFKAKHLGFYLGPLKDHLSFLQPLRNFPDRVNLWAQTDGGSLLAVLAHKVYILPVVLFVAQHEDLPWTGPNAISVQSSSYSQGLGNGSRWVSPATSSSSAYPWSFPTSRCWCRSFGFGLPGT